MRQIKFRAKRIDNGEWVYGHYFERFERAYIMVQNVTYQVDESTLGQFIGLWDVKDAEIAEGDVFEVTDGDGWVIGKHTAKMDGETLSFDERTIGVIIGNVTDNKELLS